MKLTVGTRQSRSPECPGGRGVSSGYHQMHVFLDGPAASGQIARIGPGITAAPIPAHHSRMKFPFGQQKQTRAESQPRTRDFRGHLRDLRFGSTEERMRSVPQKPGFVIGLYTCLREFLNGGVCFLIGPLNLPLSPSPYASVPDFQPENIHFRHFPSPGTAPR